MATCCWTHNFMNYRQQTVASHSHLRFVLLHIHQVEAGLSEMRRVEGGKRQPRLEHTTRERRRRRDKYRRAVKTIRKFVWKDSKKGHSPIFSFLFLCVCVWSGNDSLSKSRPCHSHWSPPSRCLPVCVCVWDRVYAYVSAAACACLSPYKHV